MSRRKVGSSTVHSKAVRLTNPLRSNAPVDGPTAAPTEWAPRETPRLEGSLPLTRIRMLFAAVLTTLVVSVAAPPAQAGTKKQMIRTINYVRGWSHLRHLHYSARLSRGAAAWAS